MCRRPSRRDRKRHERVGRGYKRKGEEGKNIRERFGRAVGKNVHHGFESQIDAKDASSTGRAGDCQLKDMIQTAKSTLPLGKGLHISGPIPRHRTQPLFTDGTRSNSIIAAVLVVSALVKKTPTRENPQQTGMGPG